MKKYISLLLLVTLFVLISNQIIELKHKNPNKQAISNYTRNRILESKEHFELTSLFGDSDYINYYYIDVFIGENKEKATLIVDTGSSILCTTCSGTCKHCGKHENPHFQTEKSKSFKTVSCTDKSCSPFPNYKQCTYNDCSFSISYGEGSSYNGVIVEDYFILGDDSHSGDQKLFPFGCVSNETNLFYTQNANGILGLAPLSSGRAAFISLAKEKELISKSIFSICFSYKGGYITFGDYTSKYHINSKINYIPYYQGSMYKINFKSWKAVDTNSNEHLISSSYYTVIDSGTTLTYLPKKLNSEFIDELISYCAKNDCKTKIDNSGCFKAVSNKQEILSRLPKFYMYLGENGEVEVVWKPANYLTVDEKNNENLCFGTYAWR